MRIKTESARSFAPTVCELLDNPSSPNRRRESCGVHVGKLDKAIAEQRIVIMVVIFLQDLYDRCSGRVHRNDLVCRRRGCAPS